MILRMIGTSITSVLMLINVFMLFASITSSPDPLALGFIKKPKNVVFGLMYALTKSARSIQTIIIVTLFALLFPPSTIDALVLRACVVGCAILSLNFEIYRCTVLMAYLDIYSIRHKLDASSELLRAIRREGYFRWRFAKYVRERYVKRIQKKLASHLQYIAQDNPVAPFHNHLISMIVTRSFLTLLLLLLLCLLYINTVMKVLNVKIPN